MNVIILAGSQPVGNCIDNRNKALLKLNGKTMVEYVIEAIKQVEGIHKIIVTGPKAELERYIGGKADMVIDSNGSIMDHVISAIKVMGTNEELLVCASDLPMITPEAIKDFLDKAKKTEASLCFPMVKKGDCVKKLPEMDKRYIRLREGTFAFTSLFFINPKILGKVFQVIDVLFKMKSRPVKIFKLIGLRYTFKLVTGKLSLQDADKKISDLFDIDFRSVISAYPEICADVDRPADIVIANAYLTN